MDDLLSELDRTIKAIEAELEKTPLFKRLRDLQAFKEKHLQHIADGKSLIGRAFSENREDTPPVAHKERRQGGNGVEQQKTHPTRVIVSTSKEVVENYGRPMRIALLLHQLEKKGIIVGGYKPQMNLASKLSSSEELYFTGTGWWLTTRKGEEPHK